jgi:hypothetical protein
MPAKKDKTNKNKKIEKKRIIPTIPNVNHKKGNWSGKQEKGNLFALK